MGVVLLRLTTTIQKRRTLFSMTAYKEVIDEQKSIAKFLQFKQEIENLLKALYKMSLSPDWSESKAQELVTWGGELYEKYGRN